MKTISLSKIMFLAAVGLTINLGLGACSDHSVAPTKAVADGNDQTDEALKSLAGAVDRLSRKVEAIKQPDPAPPVDVDAIAKAVQQKLVPDKDDDGISDVNDKCVDEAEDKDGFEDEDGCPELDNDLDNILDGEDKCPDIKGLLNVGDDDNKGCPDPKLDLDGDGVMNGDDDCLDEAGVSSDEDGKNGCPTEEAAATPETPPPADPAATPETPPPATDCHDKPAKKVIVVKVLTKEEQDAAIAKLQAEMLGQRGQWDAIKALRDKDVEHDRKIGDLMSKYGKLADGWPTPPPTPALPVATGAVSLGEPEVIVKP